MKVEITRHCLGCGERVAAPAGRVTGHKLRGGGWCEASSSPAPVKPDLSRLPRAFFRSHLVPPSDEGRDHRTDRGDDDTEPTPEASRAPAQRVAVGCCPG
ncbi:hypothetical protein L1785_12140 [Antribacter sp. KLBMP9083]|uniref:Uncharacterized protein n=1 Tax=Antribacter soli TaxID=2910976 RepID=A0AA41QEM2_9MICO|nr:hypothetical protein [Antribacter soli]MCF4121733.1 hypothetical protein [Antribacter soli]